MMLYYLQTKRIWLFVFVFEFFPFFLTFADLLKIFSLLRYSYTILMKRICHKAVGNQISKIKNLRWNNLLEAQRKRVEQLSPVNYENISMHCNERFLHFIKMSVHIDSNS